MNLPEEPHQPQCQFSGGQCSTESPHYRKVISHIFGRNKRCTIGVPDFIWIYYCRKHYQRARYRTGEWPFRQCDLAIDTIKNMRAWGGVESFNLQLRRRETERAADDEDDLVMFPMDDTAGDCGPSKTPIDDDDEDYIPEDEDKENRPFVAMSVEPEEEASEIKKRSPKIVPRPVPGWLYDRIGNNKSFSETLQIIRHLRLYLQKVANSGREAHFPDIEILPNLRQQLPVPRVNVTKGGRIASKGSVTKTKKK